MKLSAKIGVIIGISMFITSLLAAILIYILLHVQGDGEAYAMVILVCIPILSVIVTAYVLKQQIIEPVSALAAGVDRISLGDLTGRVDVRSNDELGQLGAGFNEMTSQLSRTYRELQTTAHVAEEEKARLESSINGLRQAYVLFDDKCRVTLLNEAARGIVKENVGQGTLEKEHGLPTLDDIGRPLLPEVKLKDEVLSTMQQRKSTSFRGVALAGRFLNIYLTPVLYEKEAIGCVMLLDDITEERILQRSRDEFFSIASHELRTPLTAIRGNAAMLQEFYPQLTKRPEIHETIDDIHDSAVRLIEIVNDFLDSSRLEQDKVKFTFETFALEPIVEKVIYEVGGLAKSKGVMLHYDQATLGKIPQVYADPARVTQVLYNLIGNALKFTEKGSVMINCIPQAHNIKVCVSDSGPGISAESQQLLFHKFQQSGDSILTRDSSRGTGLGLYISRLVASKMGGTVELEHSEVGKGTTFSFTIPVATKEQTKAAKVTTNE
jgi:signal transduction histidine kinase/HAMP domain-containing protein